jgi:hypothetical protein
MCVDILPIPILNLSEATKTIQTKILNYAKPIIQVAFGRTILDSSYLILYYCDD